MANETQSQPYAAGISLKGLARNWREEQQLPSLIADVATFVIDKPYGSLGYFEMPGSRFNDYWIEGGADLWREFGMFMHLPEGSEIALWFHEGAVPGGEPVVLIGSEGELRVLAPNLKSFLIDWANGRGPMDLERPDPTADDESNWSDAIAAELLAMVDKAPAPPVGPAAGDLQAFIQAYGANSRARFASDPIHLEIARVMDAHIPRGKAEYENYNCRITVAGSRIEFQTNFLPPDYTKNEPLPERDALIPLILKAREARAQGAHAARGLWHSASLQIFPNGLVMIPADWDTKPEFNIGGPVTATELRHDLSRFPRSDRWQPDWMADVLAGK